MPFQMAMAVAKGRLALNEALERMARTQQANKLVEKHELSRALATQIAMGHAELETVLARRRLETHRAENRDRSCLESAKASGEPVILAIHGLERAAGIVSEVTQYHVMFTRDGADAPEEIHKLQIKYAYAPTAWKRLRKCLKSDKRLVEKGLGPVERPQNRYSCSDKRLFRYMDAGDEVSVTLLEGETIRGVVGWFGRYEFGITIRDAEVVIFRHALYKIAPV